MSVHLSKRDKIVTLLIAIVLIGFMAMIAIFASCNFFEQFAIDKCAASCLFKDLASC
ncbi:MAG: hypothetical protein GW779_02250 [Candidatus Altiarchaeum hamiconexum]|uniref:Uncharacterized protein n=1 Tax=Candidatus Altarchaeum hamiconexum TaxID=1803513 RepID=A0A8J7YYG6_9ARCH|nr:hypothetical protein [Candidatus Altarchaeum hamiconexum]NCN68982.1 hypothetical protein [Candidatus Altarchaeum hamiconexum]NCS91231.1 hypothetical protein [Candidatus Altarchaeum hamiconexum]NCT00509.1 hypothetical protein [Candidatus Altarchaeum hamiconexum]